MLVDSLLENDALGLLVHRLAAFDEKVSGCACRAVKQEGAKGLLLRIARRTELCIPLFRWPGGHPAACHALAITGTMHPRWPCAPHRIGACLGSLRSRRRHPRCTMCWPSLRT